MLKNSVFRHMDNFSKDKYDNLTYSHFAIILDNIKMNLQRTTINY